MPIKAAAQPIEVCTMKPFMSSVLHPLWIIVTIFTVGLGLLIVALIRKGFPTRVWIEGDRLFADRKFPPQGVPCRDLQLQLVRQTVLLLIPINRYLLIHYTAENGKKKSLGINQMHHGREGIDRTIELVEATAKNG
ncbi:MAG: hypothetical protein WD768_11960 [Phycisphaeraceae bacterium]